jgi:hypothetical protein
MLQFFQSLRTGGTVSAPPTDPNKPIRRYVINSGQSNAAGRRSAGLPAQYTGQMVLNGHTAYIRNYALNPSSFEVLEAYVNTSDSVGRVGYQPSLAYHLLEAWQEDVRIVQCALGGMKINNWDDGKAFMEWLVATVNELKAEASAEGYTAKFYFAWTQGESDGGDTTGVYRDKLRSLVSRCRSRFGTPDMPFIIVQMTDCQTGVGRLTELQATQAEVATDANNHLISKESGPDVCQDNLHWAIDKYVDVGVEVATLINSLN